MNLSYKNSQESGTTLVMAVILTGLLTFAIAAYLDFTSQRHQVVVRSQYWNQCIPVAEAGVEDTLMNLGCNGISNLIAGGWSAGTNDYYMDRYLDSNNVVFYHAVVSGNYQCITSTVEGRLYLPTYLTTPYLARTVQVVASNAPLFDHGLVGIQTIDFNNQNVSLGCGATSTNNPSGLLNVNIVAQVGLLNILNICLQGDVSLGPQGVAVGANTQVTGIINLNATADVNIQFNSAVVPTMTAVPPLANVVVNARLYAYLCSGDTLMSSLNLTGSQCLMVTGNTRLYITGNLNIQNNASIYIAPGATLQLYVGGATANFSGNGVVVADQNPLSFVYYGLDSNTSVIFNGPSSVQALVYAPKASLSVGTSVLVGGILGIGGTLDLTLNGALIANTITFTTETEFTFCESAITSGPRRGYVVNSWQEL